MYMNKAIFIDKDGTLIKNIPYNVDTDKIELEAGAGALGLHHRLGDPGRRRPVPRRHLQQGRSRHVRHDRQGLRRLSSEADRFSVVAGLVPAIALGTAQGPS